MTANRCHQDIAKAPVFIGGLAHSGKTPLRIMLASHPQLAMSRRTYMWERFYNRYGDLSQRGNFERCLSAMLARRSIQVLKPDADRVRREFWQGPPDYGRLFALIHQHYADGLRKPRWGDQCGSVLSFADAIFAAYPDAKMIHMLRDPRDIQTVANAQIGRRPGRVGVATARWLYSVRLMERNLARYPDAYQVIRYETLRSEPERTLNDICQFLGERFSTTMVSGEDALSSKEVSKYHSKPKADCDVTFIQRYAGQQMRTLGYRLRPPQMTLPQKLFSYPLEWLVNRPSMLAWRPSRSA